MADIYAISITVIMVNKEGKFLIAKRSGELLRWPNKWAVPGGKLEKKDFFYNNHNVIENVARREVKEEVGLDLGEIKYLTNMAFIREDKNPYLIISLYSGDFKGEIKLNEELTEYKWVSLKEAKNYDLIEGIYEELKIVDKKLKGMKERGARKYD